MSAMTPLGPGAYLELGYADGPEGAVVLGFDGGNSQGVREVAVAAPPGDYLAWLAGSAAAFHKIPMRDRREQR